MGCTSFDQAVQYPVQYSVQQVKKGAVEIKYFNSPLTCLSISGGAALTPTHHVLTIDN
jgi:hypothetical protein